MFLEDERAAGRLRASRVSISLLVAVTALAGCLIATLGLFSAAEAGPAVASSSLQAAHADQTITHGLMMLLIAFAAANAFAIWLRRIKGIVTSGGKYDG